MKKSTFLNLFLLIGLLTIITSCNKDSQFLENDLLSKEKQNDVLTVLNSRTDSLLKRGYNMDKKLSTKDFLVYKLKDTMVFINKKHMLNRSNNSARFFTSRFGKYIMFSGESVQAGVLSAEADKYIDDIMGDNCHDDICFNPRGEGIIYCSIVGPADVCDNPQNETNFWSMPTGSQLEITVHEADSNVIWQLDEAVNADPVESFIKIG